MSDSSFPNSLGQQLKILNILFEKEMNNGLKQLGISLTGTQTAVLMQVASRDPQQLTQKEVETTLRLSHPTTRGIVKRLVATGSITTIPDATDRRQIILQLTTAGATFLEKNSAQIKAQTARSETKLTSRLTLDETQTLSQLVTKMITSLDEN
ncbi:hypothetical protein AYR62_05765 [Secundilactobacillus paracollinoides]|uniref:MarR family winged helix-turn-helix transcriptional regulator n=2 Tax=Secundilactobacillus paracollinoides TaxID=240427 RepID=UPI0006F1375F|nr:MarR family transcriptional regulator [Secundilactobacillus paracollinoides]ANZ63646.1 hypothetical protein AYR62_05765 [Secundilactobacillus paracollinoides]KRL75194.1 hypothetical protein FC17_GL002842 [Secundilactobacillus paracollinoides DSM 15502 = JCM 11969]